MTLAEYKFLAKKICKETGFVLNRIIYKGAYYRKKDLRNIIFSGNYKNNLTVLKIYNDKRLTDESLSLKYFNLKNKSRVISAPKLYRHKIISGQKGWFIAEKLPPKGNFFSQPMKKAERNEFLKIYLEYRKNFPKNRIEN